jgi:hypothetical protein
MPVFGMPFCVKKIYEHLSCIEKSNCKGLNITYPKNIYLEQETKGKD